MIYCIMRREDVSLQDFRNYFEGERRELVCQAVKELNAVDFKKSLNG
jgi:hypothetical protein